MKRSVVLFFYFIICNFASARTNYSIIFVHLGNSIPQYISVAIKQAQLFNPHSSIYFIINKTAIQSGEKISNINIVYCENLETSPEHMKFKKESTLDRNTHDGFWIKTTERFFYLDELISQFDLKSAFHMECDVMLYTNLEDILSIFKAYKNIAAIFDNDQRCIPSFLYFQDKNSVRTLAKFISDNSHLGFNDMRILAHYKIKCPNEIESLPIMSDFFAKKNNLINKLGHTVQNKETYYHKFELFNSVFDGAALGQYLGGISPRNGVAKPGFINESCIFDPSNFSYEWIIDDYGRKIPYLTYDNKKYRINNLHIHSKKLEDYMS